MRGNQFLLRTRGFTLIEILIVVAIIALLAAILFPVFARVREKGRQASCASNEKQIGLAILQYAQDYDELMPLGFVLYDQTSDNCVPQKNWYVEQVWHNPATNGLSTTWMDFILPYTKSTQIYYCPSGPIAQETLWQNSGLQRTDLRMTYGYAINDFILLPFVFNPGSACTVRIDNWSTPVGLARLQNAASLVLLTDRGQIGCEHLQSYDIAEGYAAHNPDDWRGQLLGTNPAWRHNGFSNFLFADGHVKAYNFAQMGDVAILEKAMGCAYVSNPANCM